MTLKLILQLTFRQKLLYGKLHHCFTAIKKILVVRNDKLI